MALVITVETGAGVTGANSYISRADALTFFEAYPFGADFIAAADPLKDRALAYAARVLDTQFAWNGKRTRPTTQVMQWPREGVREPDRTVPNNEVPRAIREAQCLIALSAIQNDAFFVRDPGAGGADQLSGISLGQGAVELNYQGQSESGATSNRYKTIVTPEVFALLEPYGRFRQGGTVQRVYRG